MHSPTASQRGRVFCNTIARDPRLICIAVVQCWTGLDAAKLTNIRLDDAELETILKQVVEVVTRAGGRPIIVGGAVRDALLDIAAKDIDVEVFGLAPQLLEAAVARQFAIDKVGKAFGVLKIRGTPLDISLPRRESKSGTGHKGFDVSSDPFMSFEDAASRRDFTINAMGWNPLSKTLLDPFNGRGDLKNGILRHTSAKFAEDPLRVLRGMQLAARFRLRAAPETVDLCQTMTPEGLAKERIFDEWKKLLTVSAQPSMGLTFLRQTGWVRYFPELQATIDCPQDPRWHPEGDVWTHTLHCLDSFARHRVNNEYEDLVVGLGVLCHDFGKPCTTIIEGDVIRSPGHDVAGLSLTRCFLERMTTQVSLIEDVTKLVVEHMRPQSLYDAQASISAIRRLALRVGRIDRLLRVARADRMGRPPMDGTHFPAADWLREKALEEDLERAAPTQILLGRHLLAMGVAPGPLVGHLLHDAYQAQLDGEFATLDAALEWARARVAR